MTAQGPALTFAEHVRLSPGSDRAECARCFDAFAIREAWRPALLAALDAGACVDLERWNRLYPRPLYIMATSGPLPDGVAVALMLAGFHRYGGSPNAYHRDLGPCEVWSFEDEE